MSEMLDRLPDDGKVYLLLCLNNNAGAYTVNGAYLSLADAKEAAKSAMPYADLAIVALDAAWSWRRPNAVDWTT